MASGLVIALKKISIACKFSYSPASVSVSSRKMANSLCLSCRSSIDPQLPSVLPGGCHLKLLDPAKNLVKNFQLKSSKIMKFC